MSKIDKLKLKKYKQSRLENNSISKSLLNAGYKETTANHKNYARGNKLVEVGEREIGEEIDKAGLAKKAYKTLEDNLTTDKASDRNTAASAILDFTEGRKAIMESLSFDKVVIVEVKKEINTNNGR